MEQKLKPQNMSTAKNQAAKVEAYLFFNGRCEEAIEFYRKALGAELQMLMRFKESPEPPPSSTLPPNWENKVCHATLRVGETLLMASDGCGEKANFEGFSLSFTAPTEAEAKRAFAALSAGGQVRMPLTKTFWSSCFGMVADRFGVGWMVTVPE